MVGRRARSACPSGHTVISTSSPSQVPSGSTPRYRWYLSAIVASGASGVQGGQPGQVHRLGVDRPLLDHRHPAAVLAVVVGVAVVQRLRASGKAHGSGRGAGALAGAVHPVTGRHCCSCSSTCSRYWRASHSRYRGMSSQSRFRRREVCRSSPSDHSRVTPHASVLGVTLWVLLESHWLALQAATLSRQFGGSFAAISSAMAR